MFWLDKVCIDQQNISRTLRCLPIFVQSCSKLLILCGESYVQRLWCVWELYVHFAMSGAQASKRTVITDCRPAEAVLAGGVGSAADALHTFDVKDAHCFSADDEARLRRVIESESAETFNAAIREAGAALLGAAGAPGEGIQQSVRETGAVTNAAGSLQFGTLDKNGDKRLDREDLLAAFGWDSGVGPVSGDRQEELAKRSAQVDDLLEIVNTEGELRVNGSLSIGESEFKAWIGRST